MGFVPQFSATIDSRDGIVGIALTGELPASPPSGRSLRASRRETPERSGRHG